MPDVSSSLCLHAGARQVTLDELDRVKAPPPEGRCPLPFQALTVTLSVVQPPFPHSL